MLGVGAYGWQEKLSAVTSEEAAVRARAYYVRFSQHNFMAQQARESGSSRHTPVQALTEFTWSVGGAGEVLAMEVRRLDLDSGEVTDRVRWSAETGEYVNYDRHGAEVGRRKPRAAPAHRDLILGSVGFVDAAGLQADFHPTADGGYERVFDGPLRERIVNPRAPLHERRIEMVNIDRRQTVLVRSGFVLAVGQAAAEAWRQGPAA